MLNTDNNTETISDECFLEFIKSLTPWERTKTFRYGVRLMNNCPKARRLMAMEQAGQISRQQLLSMI